MTDDASPEAAGEEAGGPIAPARATPPFAIRKVPQPTAAERQARRDAMDHAIQFGAAPYRDAEGKARYVFFKEANDAPVEAWRRDPRAKRGFRKTQQARKAAGQLIWHPEDQIEFAKRLGLIYYREGRSAEGAAERGVHDAIWRYEHVWDTFTTPRRIGPLIIETGRIAAVAEEEARKLQAEDPKARGGFFVRDRKNNGLIYVVPNPDPDAPLATEGTAGGEGEISPAGMADQGGLLVRTAAGDEDSRRDEARSEGGLERQTTAATTSVSGGSVSGGGSKWISSLPPSEDKLFELLRQHLAPIEGGYANRPKSEDPGGPTNKGVSQNLLDELHLNKAAEYAGYPTDTASLTDAQIDTILRKEIFDPLHLWEVAKISGLLRDAPQLVDQLFDMGVLHGIDDPARILQQCLYEVMGIDLRVMKNGKLVYDGIIGPATRKALEQAVLAGKAAEINNLMVDKRLDKLNKQGHKVDNSGWFPRAESFRKVLSPAAGKSVSP